MGDCTVGLDFAVVAYREEGTWVVNELDQQALDSTDELARHLRRYPGDGGALAFISVADDFFVIVRVVGPRVQWLLSDASAATEWPLAHAVVDALGVVVDDDEDDVVPAGALTLLGDFGVTSLDLALLLEDVDAFPDESLSAVATQLGFGRQFDSLIGVPA